MGPNTVKPHIFLLIFAISVHVALVNCVPTSVLVDAKEQATLTTGATKVKRNPSETPLSKQEKVSDEQLPMSVKGNLKIAPQKRGAPYQLYNENTDMPTDSAVNVPNGYWEDINTPVVYPDLSESNYPEEPLAMPLQQYSNFYGDRKKRSNANMKKAAGHKSSLAAMRSKRQSNKFSPAEILALMEWISAQKQHTQSNVNLPYDFLLPQQQLQQPDDEGEWLDGWAEPAVEYYGLDGVNNSPYVGDAGLTPRYNFDYPNRAAKRFMVSKKKRFNEGRYRAQPPQYDPLLDNLAFAYDYGRFGDVVAEPGKGHQKYF